MIMAFLQIIRILEIVHRFAVWEKKNKTYGDSGRSLRITLIEKLMSGTTTVRSSNF